LYKKTSINYPSHINRYVIDGREGMYGLNSIIFMMEKLKDKDWPIMIDGDGILIDYMNENKFIICGMQDGISHSKINLELNCELNRLYK
jgi:hypothetical protein